MTTSSVSVEITDVHVRLGSNFVLRGVSMSLAAGTVVAIIGANGCGKSTLLRVLSGQLMPNSGGVRLCGQRMNLLGSSGRARMGYAPDYSEAFLDLTGMEFLHLCQALRRVTKGAWEHELEHHLGLGVFAHGRMRALSLGQRKRIYLAAALSGDPDVLLLDEPTNGLDAHASDYVAGVVRSRKECGKITIATTHDQSLLAAWQANVRHLVDGVIV